MLIWWLGVLCGVSVGLAATTTEENFEDLDIFSNRGKKETNYSSILNFEPSRTFKLANDTDGGAEGAPEGFEIDFDTFGASIFENEPKEGNNNPDAEPEPEADAEADAEPDAEPDAEVDPETEAASNEEEEYRNGSDDLSLLIPTPSAKVTRSTGNNLGTHQHLHEPSTFSPFLQNQNSQESQQSPHSSVYLNENRGSAHHPSSPLQNQITTPYFEDFLSDTKFDTGKSSVHPSEPTYKSPSRPNQFKGYPSFTEFTSNAPLYGALPKGPQVQSTAQSTSYRTPFGQGLQIRPASAKNYAPFYRPNQQKQFQNYDPFSNIQFTTTPTTAQLNGKRMAVPVLQLQTDYPGYIQTLETTPVVYSTEPANPYRTHTGFGVSFDFAKPKNVKSTQRLGTNTPFLSTKNYGQLQVLPLPAATSTAKFPTYNGASVTRNPGKGFSKIPNDYQELRSQPQLHFNKYANGSPISNHNKPLISHKSEKIRSDVEIIDKKKHNKPPIKNDEDDEENNSEGESSEGYKNTDRYFPKNDDDDIEPTSRKNFKETELEGDFKPTKSYPFREYDEKFGKQKKSYSNIHNDEDDDNDNTKNVNVAAKYHYPTNLEDDDNNDENESAEDKPTTKYKPYQLRENYHKEHNSNEEEDNDSSYKRGKKESHERRGPKKSKLRRESERSREEEYEEKPKQKYAKSSKNSKPNSREWYYNTRGY